MVHQDLPTPSVALGYPWSVVLEILTRSNFAESLNVLDGAERSVRTLCGEIACWVLTIQCRKKSCLKTQCLRRHHVFASKPVDFGEVSIVTHHTPHSGRCCAVEQILSAEHSTDIP